MENFGFEIKQAREQKGWLLRQAAAKLDIDQSLTVPFSIIASSIDFLIFNNESPLKRFF
jgi:hypothetical protein